MAYKDITEGEKKGKARAIRYIESNSGTPGIEVAFEFYEPNSQQGENLSWTGWLTDKAKKNTMDTLVDVLGFNGSEETDMEGKFTDAKVLDFGREVTLVIEMEQGQGENSDRVYPKIKWVNSVGGSRYKGATPEVVKSSLASLGFKGLFLAAKQGQASQASSSAAGPQGQQTTKKQVPF